MSSTPPTEPAHAPSASAAPARRRRFVLVALLAVVLVGTGAAVGWWKLRPRPAVPPAVPTEGARADVAAALTAARNEVVANPKNGTAWGLLGMTFTAHAFDDQAAECYREAHRLNKDDDRWPYLLALYYITDGRNPSTARELLETALACPHQDVSRESAVRLRLAEVYLEQLRLSDAERLFREHLSRDPQSPRGNVGLGVALLTANRPADARGPLAEATNSPFTRRKATTNLAVASRLLGDHAAATRYEQQAAKLPEDLTPPDPFAADAAALRVGAKGGFEEVTVLVNEGRIRETIPLLTRMAEDPSNVRAAVVLGQHLALLREYAAAEPYLRSAYSREPENAQAALTLGTTLYDLAQAETTNRERKAQLLRDSADASGRAIKLNPTLGMAHLARGMALQALGDQPAALGHLRLAAECRPEVPQIQLGLLKALVDGGLFEEARARLPIAERVVPAEHPGLIDARKRLGARAAPVPPKG